MRGQGTAKGEGCAAKVRPRERDALSGRPGMARHRTWATATGEVTMKPKQNKDSKTKENISSHNKREGMYKGGVSQGRMGPPVMYAGAFRDNSPPL